MPGPDGTSGTGWSAREFADETQREARWLTDWSPNLRRRVLTGLWDREEADLRRSGVTRRAWEERAIGAATGSLPALDAFVEVCRRHMAAAGRMAPHPRRPRLSDAGDLVHMAYMPYVDVLRCDAHGATVAGPVAERLGGRVARSIEECLEFAETAGDRRM